MSVEVKLELGHKASLREKPTPEGFTHNWTVFVKGCEGSNICHFVDKVVFHLHESFPKPKRVVKEPPYQVSESGYAGFIMPIEVYFRSKEEPKKVRFEYDLYLRLEGLPVHNIRLEKLTFQNPSEDFRRKLLKARADRSQSSVGGGGGAGLPTLAVAPLQHSEEARPLAHVKPVAAIAEKKARNHTPAKEPSKPAPPVTKPSQPFNDIFGPPIKPKHSPEPSSKIKEISHSNHQKQNKSVPPAISPVGVVPSKDSKAAAKDVNSTELKEPKQKAPKVEKDHKSAIKRVHTAPDENQHALSEKKRKHNSSSSNSGKPADGTKVKEEKEKKDKHKSKSNLSVKKEKHKSSNVSQHKDLSKSPKVNNNNHKLPLPEAPPHSATSNDVKGAPSKVQENVSDPPSSAPSDTPDDTYHPLSPFSKDVDFLSPMSSDEESPHPKKEKLQPANHNTETNHCVQDEEIGSSCSQPESLKSKSTLKNKTSVKKHRGKQNGASKENQPSPVDEKPPRTGDFGYHQELVDLQKKIMSLNDQQQLQRVVDVIEKTGKYHITSSSFDFDLYSLDQNTVRQLKSCLSM